MSISNFFTLMSFYISYLFYISSLKHFNMDLVAHSEAKSQHQAMASSGMQLHLVLTNFWNIKRFSTSDPEICDFEVYLFSLARFSRVFGYSPCRCKNPCFNYLMKSIILHILLEDISYLLIHNTFHIRNFRNHKNGF